MEKTAPIGMGSCREEAQPETNQTRTHAQPGFPRVPGLLPQFLGENIFVGVMDADCRRKFSQAKQQSLKS